MSVITRRIVLSETDDNFSIIIIPDTQNEIKTVTDTRFNNRADWIVANKSELQIRYVLQVGDLTDWGEDDESHFTRASDGLAKLEAANICYALCPGNHDTRAVKTGGGARDTTRTRELVRETPMWAKYFPPTRFPMLRGVFEEGKSDNCYHTFQGGGQLWLVLALEFMPRYNAVSWAKAVVENHPNHNIILLTHMFLNGDGSIGQSGEYGESSPQYVFDNLVKVYPNFKFVFGGHMPTWSQTELTGVNGNKIYAFNDCWHHATNNPTRVVKISAKANRFDTYVYMPQTSNVQSGTTLSKDNVVWAA
jgi:hypothetical protein